MSAIEIMDPKMDAGMVCNRKRTVLQMDEAISVCLMYHKCDILAIKRKY